jgi:hypothetical protein
MTRAITNNAIATTAAAAALAAAGTANAVTTTFDNGTEGWSVSGRTTINTEGGNPGAHLDTTLIDVFGADIRNTSNPDFIGDLSRFNAPIEFSVDIRVNSITFSGNEVSRELVLDLRDDNPAPDETFPASVFFSFGDISAADTGEWTTFSVLIDDPTQTTLPDGWRGSGAEDPDTFEPILPLGRTFADVLAGVDKTAFTTFVPGLFFGFTDFDIDVDNPTLRVIPAPTTAAPLAILAGAAATRRRR